MQRLSKISNGVDKILPIIKPIGFSTYDIIRLFKKETGFSGKLGHGGTLDPFASGVVLLLLGKATKKFEEIKKQEKVYLAGIRLGAQSSTGDPEGKIEQVSLRKPPETSIIKALKKFEGETKQKIPSFSAAKHQGKPLYKLARQGRTVEKAKQVAVREIEFLTYCYPLLAIRIFCGGGTYIRQLAEDIGEELGCGAYLYYLEREAVGHFHRKACYFLEEFKGWGKIF